MRGLAILLCLVLAGEAAASESGPWQRWAVVVGTNTGAASREDLRYAGADAARIADLFVELGGIPRERVNLLLNRDAATLGQVLDRVEQEILAQPEGTRTFLLFFFSGHADTSNLELGRTRFPLEELKKRLRGSSATVRLGLVDACHSGALVRYKGGRRIEQFPIDLETSLDAAGYAVLTSSTASERSQESEELKGSFFTHFLVSGLRGEADSSGDGQVTLDELYRFTYRKTLERSLEVGGEIQHPTFDLGITGRGELVLARMDRALAMLTFDKSLDGNFLVYSEEREQVVAEVDKKLGEVRTLAVPPGSLEVFKRDDRRLLRTTLELKQGENRVLRDQPMKEIARTYLREKGMGPALVMGASMGYQFFWDSGIRRTSLLPSFLGGIQSRVAGLGHRDLDLGARLMLGGGTGSIMGANRISMAQEMFEVTGAAGLYWHLLRWPVDLALGGELGVMYVSRTTKAAGLDTEEEDRFASVAPAGVLELGIPLGRIVRLELTGRVGYYPFKEDGVLRHLGFTELLGGIDFRF